MSAPAVHLPRRRLLKGGGILVLLLSAPMLAHGASILAVRVWPAQDYTRITLESDMPLAARHFMTTGPERLVIDIEGLELTPTLRDLVGKVRPDDPYLGGVRVGQNQPRVVRLVLDLKQPTRPQVFTLQPVAAYSHRMVFDLHPVVAPDPLLALIRDREQSEQQAAQAMNDALGDFIGNMDRRPPARRGSPQPPVARADEPPPLAPGDTDRLIVVALDPGHGGEDPGAIGPNGLREKDVVLSIARQLRDRINAQPGMRAMMTRDADFFVPLGQRVEKARRVQADLFISIHADAFTRPEARGASVFVLSERGATSTAARWLADKENAADVVGGVNVKVQDATLLRTMLDMSTTAQINQSLRLGSEMLQHIGQVGRLHKPRVEQAGFAVLKAPDIPSILVETAFISNPEEEALLADRGYQRQLVDALFAGVMRYFAKNPPMPRNRTT
ncbi:N-acetylmuramoyl-L-alanine amidase [Caldimonas tepidiphila]|uniref:N-acetylmuramoyl-L-alanine amidase n=1 Tax=Caldimonas tepidiphila TaxID=2315841 RepID=UPI000E5B2F17|nr:N-acetylmuramoyl-L-alanine amidase [Caldimonas tepidiphila]